MNQFVLFAISISLAFTSFAQGKEPGHTVVSQTTASIRLNDLRCVIALGIDQPVEKRTTLQLGSSDPKALPIFLSPESVPTTLQHSFAISESCDIPEVDELKKESLLFFGFLHEIPVTITTKFSAPFQIHFGGGPCRQNIHEQVEIALSKKVKLVSNEYQTRPSSECE